MKKVADLPNPPEVQWPLTRKAGLTISIHCVFGKSEFEAFVKADDVEKLLTQYDLPRRGRRSKD